MLAILSQLVKTCHYQVATETYLLANKTMSAS
uniref:Uncharacterized protein n=1 Tax=Anguilla anguilla TaxID=7936 RepID=A0A0E9VCM7_ANGAN